jgi:hypothetical protein
LALNLLGGIEHTAFIFEVVQTRGGNVAMIASIFQSPYFSIGLVAVGLAYVIFVGEPTGKVLHHKWLPAVGWTIVAMLFAALGIVIEAARVELAVRERFNAQIDARLQEVLGPWKMSSSERETFIDVLRKSNARFLVEIKCLPGSAQSQAFANDLAQVFAVDGWPSHVIVDPRLRPDLVGISFGFSSKTDFTNNPPAEAVFLRNAFNAAGYSVKFMYSGMREDGFPAKEGAFRIVIGTRPVHN